MSKKCIFKSSDKELLFQIKTADKLIKTLSQKKKKSLRIRGAILGDGVGMGKTYTSLFTALSCMSGHLKSSQLNKQKHTSLLIIVPNDIILEKWESEIEPYAKANNFCDYIKALKESRSKIKDKLLAMTQNIRTFKDIKGGSRNVSWSIILLKRNQLKSLRENTLNILKNVVGFIIFDEAHHLKEPSIIRAFESNVQNLLPQKYAPKFLFLTATPFQKNIDQMRGMFKEPYFLHKAKIYGELSKYISDVQSYLQESSNHGNSKEEFKNLVNRKKLIEKVLKIFFVINSKDVFRKTKTKRVEHINGEIIKNRGIFENEIRNNIQRSILMFNHSNLKVLKDRWNYNYLVYRFDHKHGTLTEDDLTRFTSFDTSRHKRKIDNLYPLKLDVLKEVINNHFIPSPNAWNQKFIIFCDMVNDDSSKKDGRLHKTLQKTVLECISVKPSRAINIPELEKTLEATVKNTVSDIKNIFFTKIGDKHLRPAWQDYIKKSGKAFKKSKLYHFYGKDIKKYYECRFEKTIKQYACIEYLRRKICYGDAVILQSSKKRKKYLKGLFGRGRINKKFADTPYTREVLEEMWELHYERAKKIGWKQKKRVYEKVKKEFKAIFSNEANRIWQQWEDELPGSSLVEVYNGNRHNSSVLKNFQSPLEPLALVISKVGEEGIDLQAFTKGIIHYDFDWSPGKMVQREGRVDRIGKAIDMRGKFEVFKKNKKLRKHLKKKDLQVHYILMPHTYDERKYYRMKERQYLFNLLVPANLENEAFHLSDKLTTGKGLSFKLGVNKS